MVAYAQLLSAAHAAFRPEIRAAIQRLPIHPTDRVLDVPSGDGFYASLLAERLDEGTEVVAVDSDTGMLEEVERRERHQRNGEAAIEGLRGDAYHLPFEDESFDFVWCAQSLISLARPQERPPGSGTMQAISEIYRVLRPNGWVGLLEQDALHHVLLPWPVELELCLNRAYRSGFSKSKGRPEQLDVGRRLGRMLSDSGFDSITRSTIAADRYGIPDADERSFLNEYFDELRSMIRHEIRPSEWQEFNRLTNPKVAESFFNDPHFEMTWLSFVAVGRKRTMSAD